MDANLTFFVLGVATCFDLPTELQYCGTALHYVSYLQEICWKRYLRHGKWTKQHEELFRVAECCKRHCAVCK